MNSIRRMVRTATALAGSAIPPPHENLDPPVAAWTACLRSRELLAVVEQRGWRRAREACRRDLASRFEQLYWSLDVARTELAEPTAPRTATAREIYDDLVALERDFPRLRVDLQTREVAVTTEPITLAGVALGPFEIVLDGQNLEARSPYRVIALEPNAPAVDDTVTHPHVRDDELCEGEASLALRRALQERRLLDFFTIVAQTLATYNGASAFVRLEEWGGVSCRECGDQCDPENSSSCERCSCDLCDGCGACCRQCDRLCCHDCVGPCHGCDENVCGACERRCAICRQNFCQECLDDELCRKCGAAAEDGTVDAAAACAPGAADAAADAHRLGQAGVSA